MSLEGSRWGGGVRLESRGHLSQMQLWSRKATPLPA